MDVLSEDSIIKWYKDSHTTKGKSVFLPQMAKMVEWLENAEEGKKFLCVSIDFRCHAAKNIGGFILILILTYKADSLRFTAKLL